jgi:DNA-directed RNA polymerase specialized sigma24 family protein
MAITVQRKPFDAEQAKAMHEEGKSLKAIGQHFGVSVVTARKRVKEIGVDTSHSNFSWRDKRPATSNLSPMELLATLAIFAYGKTAVEAGEWLNIPRSTAGESARRGARKLLARGLPKGGDTA